MSETIHICYTLSDINGNYSKFLGASLYSLLQHTKAKLAIHVLHDGRVSPADSARLRQLAAEFDQQLYFYPVPQKHEDLLTQGKKIFSAGLESERYTSVNMYRLLIPQVLPTDIRRVIYLDADTIVNLDIASLWHENMAGYPLAAVPDLAVLEHYGQADNAKRTDSFLYEKCRATMDTVFNTGVLLLNIESLRQRNLFLEGLQFLAAHQQDFKYYDNDILIAFFSQDYQHLPWHYNIRLEWSKAFDRSNIVPGIYHYLGRDYGLDTSDVYNRLFLQNLRHTPWWQEDILFQSYQVMQELVQANLQKRLRQIQQIENTCRRKQRVFVGLAGDEARLRQDFALEPEEKYIALSPGGQLSLPYDPQTHIYLIFWSNYGEIKTLLEKAGLREYLDFADGTRLMPEQTGDIIPTELTVLWQI